MPDREQATRNFGMVWQNDYDAYHLVLAHAKALLRANPGMTDLTLGRNVKDYVFALRNDGGWGHPTGISTPRMRDVLQWIDADSHGDVDELDVAEDVRYGLGCEA